MKTKEENMGKEKELLSNEELLEVAAGRFPWDLDHNSTPQDKARDKCRHKCTGMTFSEEFKNCIKRCDNPNSF